MKIIDEVGNLIGKDRLQAAIDLLHKLLANSPLLDEVVVQSARYNELIKKIRQGSLNLEDASVTKNQIRSALLDLAREVEDSVKENPKIKGEVESFQATHPVINITQNHYGTGDNIGGDKIINA